MVQEKDQMLKYVEEEVDRVKGLFEQKEARLTSERDSAKQAAQQLAREQGELTQKLQHLEQELQQLPGALEVTLSCLFVLLAYSRAGHSNGCVNRLHHRFISATYNVSFSTQSGSMHRDMP